MKSEFRQRAGRRAAVVGAVIGGLALIWSFPFLPGRVPWLHYSLPPTATSAGDEVVVPVPSDAPDGTEWRVETTLGSSPSAGLSRLTVTRWLSTTTTNPGEEVAINGVKYRYVGLRRPTSSSTTIILRRH